MLANMQSIGFQMLNTLDVNVKWIGSETVVKNFGKLLQMLNATDLQQYFDEPESSTMR
jgi:hypothetical protein